MQLACTSCGANFRKQDLNFEYGIATCPYCHAVTRLRPLEEPAAPDSTARRERPRVPQPKGVSVEDLGHTLRITRRWFSPVFVFLVFFCVAWNSFLIVWYSLALGGFMGDAPGPFRWLAIVFPIAHVAVGVGLTYFTIAGFLNRTVIEAAAGELSVRHGPVPWPGNQTVRTDDLDQLYCREHVSRGRDSTSVSYRLHAVLRDGRKLKLLDHLSEPDQALFIEQELEDHLGIPNRKIAGEYGG